MDETRMKNDKILKLLMELQRIGTVPAIDINEYGKFLTNF